MEKTFTIFTPTYNRKEKLARTYNSLKEQTFKDFCWLIIDDGSSDDTKSMVETFSGLCIKYIYTKNGGKQRAYNRAIEEAKSKYFICLDSDDTLTSNALEKIFENMEKLNKTQVGVGYLSGYDENTVIGTKVKIRDASIFDQYNKYGVSGDKGLCFKLNILKNYRFCIFDNEKFITEAYLYDMLSMKYTLMWINEILEIKEYLGDGLTFKYDKLLCSNPLGQSLFYNQRLLLKKSIINASLYVKFSLIAKKSFFRIIREANTKTYVLLSYPIGLYMYLKWRINNFIKKAP